MKNIWLLLSGLILIISQASAEKVIYVNLMVQQNDSVVEDYVIITDGRATHYQQLDGDYAIEVRGLDRNVIWRQGVVVTFEDERGYYSTSYFSYKIPYQETMKTFVMLHGKKEIYLKDIAECNQNRVCDGVETHFSCPSDCPLNQSDHLCNKEKDGACDPDCGEDVDPDCGKKEESGYVKYLLFAFPIILLAVAFIFYRKKQAQKIKKAREEFIRWKEEQELLKNTGKPSS
jgi:hypothetical protein